MAGRTNPSLNDQSRPEESDDPAERHEDKPFLKSSCSFVAEYERMTRRTDSMGPKVSDLDARDVCLPSDNPKVETKTPASSSMPNAAVEVVLDCADGGLEAIPSMGFTNTVEARS